MYMDVDAALTEVPVNICALIDDTDFKTIEDAIAYNAAGMDLVWNFVTSAGVFTQTAVTPTAAGDYDWTNQGNGMYTIEIPASGGASINNDTEGTGWFTGFCTGVLPWTGPKVTFRASGINDLLIDNTYSGRLDLILDDILVDTNILNDTKIPQTLNLTPSGNIGIDWANVENPTTAVDLSGTDIQLADTVTTNTDMRGTDNAATAAALATHDGKLDTIDANVDTLLTRITSTIFAGITSMAEWLGIIAGKQVGNATARTEIRATGAGSGTFDETTDSQEAIRDRGDAAYLTATGFSTHSAADVRVEMDSNSNQLASIVSDTGTNLPGQITALNNLSQAEAQTAATAALTDYDPPTRTEATADKDEVLAAATAIEAKVDTVDTVVDGIKAKTDNFPEAIQRNTAFANFPFTMVDSSGDPLTGLTVTATRRVDGGAFAACANSVTEVGNGWYTIDLAAADLNGTIIALRFTAATAQDRNIVIKTVV